MKGTHRVIVESPRLKYVFEIRRNITIIQGDSATGKTTLVDLIRDYRSSGNQGLIRITGDCPCTVFTGNEQDWKAHLEIMHGSIIFIDEGYIFIRTKEFADFIQGTDNYYVLITREALKNLPYSVNEIYGIRTAGKYHFPEQVYHEFYAIYPLEYMEGNIQENAVFLSEDSKSGFQFLQRCCPPNVECISASGNSNIYAALSKVNQQKMAIIVADGAAFGAYMEKIMAYIQYRKHIMLYLPESFEWIILKSDILQIPRLREILESPSDYIACEKYFSWEQYFTELLVKYTQGSVEARYRKEQLPEYYMEGRNKERIQGVFPKEIQKVWEET